MVNMEGMEGYRSQIEIELRQTVPVREEASKKLLKNPDNNLREKTNQIFEMDNSIKNLQSQLRQLDSFKLADNKIKKIEGSTSYKIGLFLEKKGSFITNFFRKITGTATQAELETLKKNQSEALTSFGNSFIQNSKPDLPKLSSPLSSSKQKKDAQLQSEAEKANFKEVFNKIRHTPPPS